jgi:hypothetical protein
MSQPQNFLTKEETKMKLFGAIDLHSNNNVTVLINEKDVVESTYNWYWLVDGLMEREVIEIIWPTPRPLNNTVDSNTPTMIRTHVG